MDLSPTDEQRQLAEALARFLAKASSPAAVRAAEASGFDPLVWEGLVDIGAVAMGVPTVHGGLGAALADLAVVARECGAALAAAPVVESAVAARLLARAVDERATAAAEPWLGRVVAGGDLVTFSPRRATGGTAALVPGAGAATAAVVSTGSELLLVPLTGSGPTVATLGDAALADVPIDAGTAVHLASGTDAAALFDTALDEWRALSAAWLSGLGRQALSLAVEYARERVQFDVPIGSFQAVQHRLADAATVLDGAALLAAKAVWALDEGEAPAPLLAPMAFWFAGEAAQQAASWALHFHGGYGFMEEYDIQLHFRRAKAARLVLGDPRRELQVVADRLYHGDRAPATTRIAPAASASHAAAPSTRRGPDFRLDDATEAFRSEVRSFLAQHVTSEVIETAHRTGTIHDWGLHRAMASQGWLSASWPRDVGGQGRSPLEMNVLSEEMYLSGAPVDGLGVASLVAHTLLFEGSDWQRATIVPEILSGEVICCLGYSEPDAGSDVAACTTRAERRGDHWVVNGQKMFTTLAHEAGYVFLLTRTNPEVAKHRGLTMFVVPMSTPGIELTPVHTMGGERTNITFYNDVVVDDRYRVGEVDGGWQVMMTALVFERNSSWVGESVRLLDHASRWAAGAPGPDGRPLLADPLVRDRLAAAAVGNEVASLLGWRAAWMASTGTLPGVEGTMAKLFTTEHYQRCASELIDVLGAEGLRRHGEPGAAADGWVEATYRHCQVTTIYGGTSEVLRGIVAQRGLGLPKAR